jgi:hypothetical protein
MIQVLMNIEQHLYVSESTLDVDCIVYINQREVQGSTPESWTIADEISEREREKTSNPLKSCANRFLLIMD